MTTADHPEYSESTPLLAGGGVDDHGATEANVRPRATDLGPGASNAGGPSDQLPTSPIHHRPTKSSTNDSWGDAVGLPMREPNDESLVLFRRALGIHAGPTSPAEDAALEEGRKKATGIYASVIQHQRRKRVQYLCLLALIYICHFTQVVLGAVMTVLGPQAQDHKTAITVLGVSNTVVAGFLALITRLGATEKLQKDGVHFRQLQTWIEETDALLALGVIGRDRAEVGKLVQLAFKKYNSTEEHEETNQPGAFIPNTNKVAPDDDDGEEEFTSTSRRAQKSKASSGIRRWLPW